MPIPTAKEVFESGLYPKTFNDLPDEIRNKFEETVSKNISFAIQVGALDCTITIPSRNRTLRAVILEHLISLGYTIEQGPFSEYIGISWDLNF